MAQHETREIASYLRDGSLWVGHFVVSNGELNFGDDRMDAAHGLANLLCTRPTNSTKERGVAKFPAVVERLKLAA